MQLWQRVTPMIWIECDCCQRTLTKHEPYSEITIKSLGPSIVPMTHTTHICEKCMLKIMKAAEVIKHDA